MSLKVTDACYFARCCTQNEKKQTNKQQHRVFLVFSFWLTAILSIGVKDFSILGEESYKEHLCNLFQNP